MRLLGTAKRQLWSAATGQSIGCAGLALTRRRVSPHCLMAWVAFDRTASYLKTQGLAELSAKWREIADEIHADVCELGFDRELGSFVQAYGLKGADASLLLLPLVG